MTGPWKAWKSKNRFPTISTVPWNLAKTRDSHIPTAARDDDSGSLSENQRKEVGRCAAYSFPFPFTLRSNGPDFMLIVQLENALIAPHGTSRLVLSGTSRARADRLTLRGHLAGGSGGEFTHCDLTISMMWLSNTNGAEIQRSPKPEYWDAKKTRYQIGTFWRNPRQSGVLT